MISVIIPIATHETQWQALIPLLKNLPDKSEIILAVNQESSMDVTAYKNLIIAKGKSGRAQQMNAGVKAANCEWLWFLHADSRFDGSVIPKLIELANSSQEALFYHTLRFSDDGPKAMRWNELAVKLRSDFMKIPFGDQGFFMRKDLFEKLGMYREDLAYGEDHVFVWKTRQEGYEVLGTGTHLFTSARKYAEGGWINVTLRHVWYTIKQGIPESIRLLKRQINRTLS